MCPLGPTVSNPSVLSGHPPNKMSGGFPWALLEGQSNGGRIPLGIWSVGTDSSHLDSNLGSRCFSCVTLSKLLNHSQLLFLSYKIGMIMQNVRGQLLRCW